MVEHQGLNLGAVFSFLLCCLMIPYILILMFTFQVSMPVCPVD